MKALLCSLILGLLVASQGDAQTDASQFTGRWITHYIAADNIEKITEDAPFHIFMRYIEFDEENGTILYHFYVKEHGECIEKYVSGTKEENFYAVDYAGHSEFRPVRVENGALIAHVINVDEHGKETQMVQLFGISCRHTYPCVKVAQSCLILCDPMDYTVHGILQARILQGKQFFFLHGDFTGRGDDVGPECKEEFHNTVKEKGIPEENILNFIDNDNCPEE